MNNDNILNISDVVILLNAIISGDTEELLSCGDVNGDGILNVSDLIIIVNLILGND